MTQYTHYHHIIYLSLGCQDADLISQPFQIYDKKRCTRHTKTALATQAGTTIHNYGNDKLCMAATNNWNDYLMAKTRSGDELCMEAKNTRRRLRQTVQYNLLTFLHLNPAIEFGAV